MEESHDVDKSDSSLNESTAGSLNGTFTLEKPTLGVESTPKLTLPVRRKVDTQQSFVPIRRNAAESAARENNSLSSRMRPPGSSKRQLRHAPYQDDSVRTPRRMGGTQAGFSSEQVQRSQRQTGCTLSNLDVCRLYMQHLSPDSQRDQSASVKLLNSNAAAPTSARRTVVSLAARYALAPTPTQAPAPTLTQAPEVPRPDDTLAVSEEPHALDDANVRKRLICDFLADEDQTQTVAAQSDCGTPADTACQPITVECPPTPRGQSMPDLITSTLPKDTLDDKKAFCGSENDPAQDGLTKYALLTRNDFVVARAASFEYRPARPDPCSPARGPLRVTAASVDEWEPRAAKLKKCGSGDQLQLAARPRPAQRSGSACDAPRPEPTTDTTHETLASVTSSLASSQSTVDSIENGSFTRPVRLSPYLSRPTLADAPLANFDSRPPLRRPACSVNVRQLVCEMNESAMLNYDEEVMEHFGNGLRAVPQPLGLSLGFRTASPLRAGLENLRPAPVPVPVLDNGYAHSTYCDGALCASPAGAGRSAYFPLAYERCTNPVSDILEHGDDKHFIPLGTPTRDDIIG